MGGISCLKDGPPAIMLGWRPVMKLELKLKLKLNLL